MNTFRIIFATMMVGVFAASAFGQTPECMKGIDKKTFVYAVRDGGDTLRLDVLTDPTVEFEGPRPAIFFASGGGWEFQNRETASSDVFNVLPYFARQGYVAVQADYRTDFARARKTGEIPDRWIGDFEVNGGLELPGVWPAIDRAVKYSIEDLFDATTFIVDHASEWQIDPAKITAMGNSASAIAFLTAENLICNDSSLVSHLPDGFNYSSVIACAGGVWKSGLDSLEWNKTPCPIMIFHGDADFIVPFRTRYIPDTGGALHGVESMIDQFDKMGISYAYYLFLDDDHNVSGHPMHYNAHDMFRFVDRINKGYKVVWRQTQPRAPWQ